MAQKKKTDTNPLEDRRQRIAELNDQVRQEQANRDAAARQAEEDVQVQVLDAEINRLEQQLALEQQLTAAAKGDEPPVPAGTIVVDNNPTEPPVENTEDSQS